MKFPDLLALISYSWVTERWNLIIEPSDMKNFFLFAFKLSVVFLNFKELSTLYMCLPHLARDYFSLKDFKSILPTKKKILCCIFLFFSALNKFFPELQNYHHHSNVSAGHFYFFSSLMYPGSESSLS